jgi:hypothetical protein
MRALLAWIAFSVSVVAPATLSLPQYEIGDAFIYDNGRVEQLVSTAADRLTWSAFEGRKYVRDRNFVVPLLQWETVESHGTREVSPDAAALWPLAPGKTVRFRVVTDVTRQVKEGSDRRRRRAELWTCRVLPPAAVTVPAGTFDALEIRCEEFSSTTMRLLSEERWYYSEEVGHYVARRWTDLSTGRRGGYSLAAKLRGMEANPRRIRSILSTL